MNIFILDTDTQKCAQYHNDRHCSKMILESAQLLSTTMNFFGLHHVYRPTHKNHPCSKWLRESYANFEWLVSLTDRLDSEFYFRFKNIHKSAAMVREHIQPYLTDLKNAYERNNIPTDKMTPFAQAMPDILKSDDAVISYRNYYIQEKQHLAKWSKRETPEWWVNK